MTTSRTFRIFVSSTFSDMKEERNALARWVFPKLRELCEKRGYKFQAVDLRWGVRDEAAADQQTVRICLDEITRCQRLSPKPHFIALLGERYGWCPPPSTIWADEMDGLRTHLAAADAALVFGDPNAPHDADLVTKYGWYRRDDNAMLAEYVLQPRRGEYQASEVWQPIERRLREALVRAAGGATSKGHQLRGASATELEIIEGALKVGDAHDHVFAFVRKITNCDDVERSLPSTAALELLDTAVAPGAEKNGDRGRLVWDRNAWRAQLRLRSLLADRLGEANIWRYEATWKDGALDLASVIAELPVGTTPAEAQVVFPHTRNLCEAVWQRLSRVIVAEMAALDASDRDFPRIEERAHGEFGKNRALGFTGRAEALARIERYLDESASRPLVVHGKSGSGKSALMARAAELARVMHPNAVVIQRFIGAVPGASEATPLLESLYRELSQAFGDNRAIDRRHHRLFDAFWERLALASADKPVVLFLDALDQLGDTDNGRRLEWLPRELPPHVRVVVSTLREEQYLCFPVLSARAEPEDLVELPKMSVEEAGQALDTWLQSLANPRTLTFAQRRQVLGRFQQNGLPLYLRLAFEEARCWHSYDQIPDHDATQVHDVPSLISALFARLERQHKIVAPQALGFLAMARYGLSDEEMLALLWRDDRVREDFNDSKHHDLPQGDAALPPIVWFRLYFDLEPYLARREVFGVGLLTFYHRQLAEVATAECIAARNREPEVHADLARYFAERWQVPDTHALLELPYHQMRIGTFPSVLTDLRFIEAKSSAGMLLQLINDFVMAQRDIGADIPPEARARLNEFSSFVTKSRIVLTEMPDLTFQQAANEAAETAPAMAATVLWASRLERRPWLKVEYRDGSSANALVSVRSQKQLLGAALSANGKRLAIQDGDVRVFDVESNRELLRHPARHGRVITAAALSTDGQQLGQAEHVDGEPAICSVWRIEVGAQVALGRISLDLVSTIHFDAQGDLFLGGSSANGGGLVHWNQKRASASWSQNVPGAVIRQVSAHDEVVVAAQGDGVCSIWHGRDGCSLASRVLHSGPINAIGVSPNGTVVVSGGADHNCIVWSVGSGHERRSMFYRLARNILGSKLAVFARHRAAVTAAAFLTEDWVASGDAEGIVWIWKVDDERESWPMLAGEGSVLALETSGDRRSLLVAFSTDRTAQVLDVSSLTVQVAQRRSALSLVELDGGAGAIFAARQDGRLERLRVTDERECQSWQELESFPGALLWAMCPAKASVLAVNHDSTWRVRDVAGGATISGRLEGPVGEGALAAIAPDGKQIAVYYRERIVVASIRGGQRQYELPMIAKAIRFDADAALRIVGFSTRLGDRPAGTVCASSIEHGAHRPGFSAPLDSKVLPTDSSATFTADGFLIAGRTGSGGGRLEIWNPGVDCTARAFDTPVRLHGASISGTWCLLSCPASSICHVVDVANAELPSTWRVPTPTRIGERLHRSRRKAYRFRVC